MGRKDAGVNRIAIDHHRAGAAIAGIAPLFDTEPSELTQESAQALPGPR
jgi:hypothetical protein